MATSVIDGLERFFDGMGLMTGENAVPKRMVVGGLISAFLVTFFKPDFMFENGKPRQWSLMPALDGDDGTTPTLLPWWSVIILGAVVAGVFI